MYSENFVDERIFQQFVVRALFFLAFWPTFPA